LLQKLGQVDLAVACFIKRAEVFSCPDSRIELLRASKVTGLLVSGQASETRVD